VRPHVPDYDVTVPHRRPSHPGANRGHRGRRDVRSHLRRHPIRRDRRQSAVRHCQGRRLRERDRGRVLASPRGGCDSSPRAERRRGRGAAEGPAV